MKEKVNNPDHYRKIGLNTECIDIAEHCNFNIGNAIKYLWRAGHKADELTDLKKCRWYIEREIVRYDRNPFLSIYMKMANSVRVNPIERSSRGLQEVMEKFDPDRAQCFLGLYRYMFTQENRRPLSDSLEFINDAINRIENNNKELIRYGRGD